MLFCTLCVVRPKPRVSLTLQGYERIGSKFSWWEMARGLVEHIEQMAHKMGLGHGSFMNACKARCIVGIRLRLQQQDSDVIHPPEAFPYS